MQKRIKSRVASHWRHTDNGNAIECRLCPRHCRLKPNHLGFCGVRGNINNEQHTFNYGYGLPIAIEVIESEAIYHFCPSAKILCVGNIGCMLECHFCQNWQTSQTKHFDWRLANYYSPEAIIDIAIANDVNIISWTYNDPVVWHEFVIETARLASNKGIINLYKSSLYIENEPLNELLDVIDIFSVSLKSMSQDFYRNYTKGRLSPVLDAIKHLDKNKDKHIEISQLVVTGLNDNGTDACQTAQWIANNISTKIPLHFVAFHPAYKYTTEPRTVLEKLIK